MRGNQRTVKHIFLNFHLENVTGMIMSREVAEPGGLQPGPPPAKQNKHISLTIKHIITPEFVPAF